MSCLINICSSIIFILITRYRSITSLNWCELLGLVPKIIVILISRNRPLIHIILIFNSISLKANFKMTLSQIILHLLSHLPSYLRRITLIIIFSFCYRSIIILCFLSITDSEMMCFQLLWQISIRICFWVIIRQLSFRYEFIFCFTNVKGSLGWLTDCEVRIS